ncbi:MAG: HpcH/HpaI aldolase/citrate lyase family protein [Alphaproteobacteria bacterium]
MTTQKQRSQLYVPGDNWEMLEKVGKYGADVLLLDLEDAVAADQKDAARELVVKALKYVDYKDANKTVRINGMDTEYCVADLEAIIPANPDAIRIPKIESKKDVVKADKLISEIEKKNDIPAGTIKIQAMIETALAVENAFEIATASKRITALTIGGQDLTADMEIQKTESGLELAYARGRLVMAAKAARISAIDTVYADTVNQDGLRQETQMIKTLGFDGKAVIHPKQIKVIHQVFNPSPKEVNKAKQIVAAFEEAQAEGIGVFAMNGKMIDAPVVARARKILELVGK